MRIFTYGCSVTDYNWPTWADIICYEYQDSVPCHNYGNSGTGNTAIAQHVAASHLEHTFTEDDLILITWSSWNRSDKLIPLGGDRNNIKYSKWGNVLQNSHYSDDYIRYYWSLEDDVMQNITARVSVDQFPGVHFNGNIALTLHEKLAGPQKDDLYENFSQYIAPNGFPTVEKTMPYHEVVAKFDGHPTPIAHLNYLDTVVLPGIGDRLTISADTRQWGSEWENWLNQKLKRVSSRQQYGDVLQGSQERRLNSLKSTEQWNSLFRTKDYMKGDNQLLPVASTLTENNNLKISISSGINRLFSLYKDYTDE